MKIRVFGFLTFWKFTFFEKSEYFQFFIYFFFKKIDFVVIFLFKKKKLIMFWYLMIYFIFECLEKNYWRFWLFRKIRFFKKVRPFNKFLLLVSFIYFFENFDYVLTFVDLFNFWVFGKKLLKILTFSKKSIFLKS